MRKHYHLVVFAAFFVFWVSPCYGEDTNEAEKERQKITMEEIIVRDKQENGFVTVKNNQPFTESTINREGITILGGPAQMSIDNTLDLFPSVNIESLDPYGINRVSKTSAIRIRGQGGDAISYTVEGIPMEIGPRFGTRQNLFDLENFSDITLYRGVSPSDQGFGWGNYAGTINTNILNPSDKMGLTVSEKVGSFNFSKTFIRTDTGEMFRNLKSFLSYSYTTADKWRGEGGSEKQHVTFNTIFTPSPIVSAKLFFDFNKEESNNYRYLNYDQASNLSAYNKYDYNTELTGTPAIDAYYYNFNRIDDESLRLFGNIQIKPANNHTITLKPYFSHEIVLNTDTVASYSGSPAVSKWSSERSRYGILADYKTRLLDTDLSIGYWFETFKWPYLYQKMYRVSSTGRLVFAGWNSSFWKYDGYFKWDSPYVTLNKTIGKANISAGLKYFRFTQPRTIKYYNSGVSDVSYDDVSDYARVDSSASVSGKTNDVFLPSAALSYTVNQHVTPYIAYGRGYRLAYFGPGAIMNAYTANRTYYNSIGVTADMLADRQEIETGDNFDLGMRLKFGQWNITPAVFYSIIKNKSVAILDQATNVQYRQTVGDARSYGAELEISGTLFRDISLFASGTYNNAEFTKNVPIKTSTVNIDGNRFPDTPEYMAKLGIIYSPQSVPGLTISPIFRYVGARYGDAENQEKVSAYSTTDINAEYKLKNISPALKELAFGFSVLNVFNARYISKIEVSDEARQTSAQYYQGSPRTFVLSMTGRF